ncbi:3520_t:CDS:2, partial [Acaulospora morrowiae]
MVTEIQRILTLINISTERLNEIEQVLQTHDSNFRLKLSKEPRRLNPINRAWRVRLQIIPLQAQVNCRSREADNLQTNIDLWNDMKKLAKSEVNNRVNMRNLENVVISTGISAGIQHFETYNSQLLISKQYAGMRFDSAEQERKRKAGENNEKASPRDHTSPLRDDFFDGYGESEIDDSGIIEWEFDSAIQTWLEKAILYHKELISEEDEDKRIKDSSKIIDGSDLDVTREYLTEEEFLELQEVLANVLELGTTINDWTILKPQAEKCLRDYQSNWGKGSSRRNTWCIKELKNFLKTNSQEFDFDLFGDSNNQTNDVETVEIDYLDEDNHELGAKDSWGREFSLCERAGSLIDNTRKNFSNTLKVKKTLRDMHTSLMKSIASVSNKRVSKEVLRSFPKLLMPGLVSSHFFLQAVLIVYVGAGFYVSTDLAELEIPTDYDELDKILKV